MADYFSPTVVQPSLPAGNITPAEALLLSAVYECETFSDGSTYYFAEERPATCPSFALDDVALALGKPGNDTNCSVYRRLKNELDQAKAQALGDISFEVEDSDLVAMFQDIIKRSATVTYITITTSFTCSKMRPDGFGGAVTIITADNSRTMATNWFVEEYLEKAGLAATASP